MFNVMKFRRPSIMTWAAVVAAGMQIVRHILEIRAIKSRKADEQAAEEEPPDEEEGSARGDGGLRPARDGEHPGRFVRRPGRVRGVNTAIMSPPP